MSKSSFCRDVRSNIWSDTFEFQIIEKLSLCFQHHVEHTYSKNVFITFLNLCGQHFMKERTQWYPLVSIWMQHLDPVELPKRLPLSLLSGQPAPFIPNHYRCCHFCFHWPGFSLPENETGPARIPRIPEPLSSICGSNLSIQLHQNQLILSSAASCIIFFCSFGSVPRFSGFSFLFPAMVTEFPDASCKSNQRP